MAEAPARRLRLLFVCLGNICRSPTAEGVMGEMVQRAGLEDTIEVDSAGTGAWHVGEPADERAAASARAHGVILDGRARQVTREDFEAFDLLLAMDAANERELLRLAPGAEGRAKVRLLREFDPASARSHERDVPDHERDVPDPYYGGASGFDDVFDLVSAACDGLLEQIRAGAVR